LKLLIVADWIFVFNIMLRTGILIPCDFLQLHVDGVVADVAEEVAAGRVAQEEVLEVGEDGENDHECHSHWLAVL
jgi:hypothetical protein